MARNSKWTSKHGGGHGGARKALKFSKARSEGAKNFGGVKKIRLPSFSITVGSQVLSLIHHA